MKNSGRIRKLAALCLALFSLEAQGGPASRLETVTLDLPWHAQFQFAGYYAALHQGFYRDAGLDVRFSMRSLASSPWEGLLRGTAEFAVTGASFLIEKCSGSPLVLLSSIFQHSPLALMVRADSPFNTLHSLVGKRVMMSRKYSVEILAMLREEGVSLDSLQAIEPTGNIDSFLRGEVDAQSIFTTNEPDLAQKQGVAVRIIEPASYGIDFYGDSLITTESYARSHFETTSAFRAASHRGWEFALAHPEEVIDLILKEHAPQKDRSSLRYEAEATRKLILPHLVSIGHTNPFRWREMVDTYQKLGLVSNTECLTNFFFDDLNKQEMEQRSKTLKMTLLALGILLVGILGSTALAWQYRRAVTRKAAELRSSESRFVDIVERLGLWVWETDRDLRVTFSSHISKKIFGSNSKDLVGKTLLDLLPSRTSPERMEKLDRALRNCEPFFDLEFSSRDNDGNPRWFSASGTPIHDTKGAWIGFRGIYRDVTQRKQLQKDVDAAEENYRLLYESMRDAFALVDMDGTIRLFNRSFRDLLGYSDSEIRCLTFKEITPPRWHEIEEEIIRTQTLVRGYSNVYEKEYVRADGGIVPVDLRTYLLRDEEGNPRAMWAFVRDISERKLIQEQLRDAKESAERANGAKDLFLANMSHEIRTPLNAIVGMAELIALSPLGDREREYVRSIETSSQALLKIVNEVLDFAKIEAGRMELSLEPMSVRQASHEVMGLFHATFQKKNLSPHLMVDPAVPETLLGDPLRLKQVLMNLVGNSAKFTQQGHVSLSVLRNPDEDGNVVLHFQVADSGIGIPAEDRELVFEPFVQSSHGSPSKTSGTGLGLPICRKIVELFGGKIWIEGVPHGGSSFHFTARFAPPSAGNGNTPPSHLSPT